jgi:(1->4)-alpha-D-glucan 1-alpha-D-glucosylmutase
MEDTSFYVYNRLVSLNEVGGHPDQFSVSVEAFHRQNLDRYDRWPHAMLTTSTHDTKRSEDVRARLNVLSELPDVWQAALKRWSRLNMPKKARVDGKPAPDRNDEYLLYQTLLGAWPVGPMGPTEMTAFRDRIAAYMQKATKEAKVHTSWINPNQEYDAAVRDFVFRLLPDQPNDPFLKDLLALQRRIAFFGQFNSLAQVLLKLTCPGVPDTYQGTELWDLSLVDPDNRRPVDYTRRRDTLVDLKERISKAGADLAPLTRELLAQSADGRIKLYTLYRALNFRRCHRSLFAGGAYLPLECSGEKREHVCAFARILDDALVLVVVPRLTARLTGGKEQPPLGVEVWRDTALLLPGEHQGRTYRNLFTGETLTVPDQAGGAGLPLAALLAHFPVALLHPDRKESR